MNILSLLLTMAYFVGRKVGFGIVCDVSVLEKFVTVFGFRKVGFGLIVVDGGGFRGVCFVVVGVEMGLRVVEVIVLGLEVVFSAIILTCFAVANSLYP